MVHLLDYARGERWGRAKYTLMVKYAGMRVRQVCVGSLNRSLRQGSGCRCSGGDRIRRAKEGVTSREGEADGIRLLLGENPFTQHGARGASMGRQIKIS
jgi:hypothetical protein